MEQRFKTSGQDINLLPLREFIEREGEAVAYRRGDQMEREGDPTRWFAYVTEGCFKFVTRDLIPYSPPRYTHVSLVTRWRWKCRLRAACGDRLSEH